MTKNLHLRIGLFLLVSLAGFVAVQGADDADESALRKAVTLYASFDDDVKADFGGGDLTFHTRTSPEKGKFLFEKGFNDKVFRVAIFQHAHIEIQKQADARLA